MARSLRTRTLTVREDETGLRIRHEGVVFRPDPDGRKRNADNRASGRLRAASGMDLQAPTSLLDYQPLAAGQKVMVTIDPSVRRDTIGVFTLIDPEGARTRAAWPQGIGPGCVATP